MAIDEMVGKPEVKISACVSKIAPLPLVLEIGGNLRRRDWSEPSRSVILSAAKDPRSRRALRPSEWILRCAQDDGTIEKA
ncbi:MAG: hypothetical protein WDM96_07200 [Lacunisphaera sp.]